MQQPTSDRRVDAGSDPHTDEVDSLTSVRQRIDNQIDLFVEKGSRELAEIAAELANFADVSASFLAGGKRLRPTLAWWGWRAAGGHDCDEALAACVSLEFVQACALVHDDVMDDSDTRRGEPSVHRQFARLHGAANWRGNPDAYGTASAILLGDLYLSWADQMLYSSGLDSQRLQEAKEIYDVMRVELMAGQFLDVTSQAMSTPSMQRSLLVAQYKSAKYTVERPLQFGAALAGASEQLIQGLAEFGLPLGEAFQLRDDVLGVFGDPSATGKPAGDDIAEGKQTYLVAAALERGSAQQQTAIISALGNPNLDSDDLAQARDAIVASGALGLTEERIRDQLRRALQALDHLPIDGEARAALSELAHVLVDRSS